MDWQDHKRQAAALALQQSALPLLRAKQPKDERTALRRNGFLLLYKRLENGRYRWPRNETEARALTRQQLRRLLKGAEIEQKKAIRPSKERALY